VTDGNLEVAFSTGGQPSGLVFDHQGSSFVADQEINTVSFLTEVMADCSFK